MIQYKKIIEDLYHVNNSQDFIDKCNKYIKLIDDYIKDIQLNTDIKDINCNKEYFDVLIIRNNIREIKENKDIIYIIKSLLF